MRAWNHQLYFGEVPGKASGAAPGGDLSDWIDTMRYHGIRVVVCLVPDEGIAAHSPEYSPWRANERDRGDYELIDFPIRDFNSPEPDRAASFWELARELAGRVQAGEKAFVHCGAGIGRAGTMAVAILMVMGRSYDEAFEAIRAAGSYPESPTRQAFLKAGPV